MAANTLNIVMTGCSTFTGFHISRHLVNLGFIVFHEKHSAMHTTLQQRRLKLSKSLPFTANYADVVILHGAPVHGYKDQNFPWLKRLDEQFKHIERDIKEYKRLGISQIIYSSSSWVLDKNNVLPYVLFKKLGEEILKMLCHKHNIRLKTIYIDQPFGSYDNTDRFFHRWVTGEASPDIEEKKWYSVEEIAKQYSAAVLEAQDYEPKHFTASAAQICAAIEQNTLDQYVSKDLAHEVYKWLGF